MGGLVITLYYIIYIYPQLLYNTCNIRLYSVPYIYLSNSLYTILILYYTIGIPAVYQRDLTEAEIKYIQYKTNENYDLSLLHASESLKSFDLIEEEEETRHQRQGRNPDYYEQLTPQVV